MFKSIYACQSTICLKWCQNTLILWKTGIGSKPKAPKKATKEVILCFKYFWLVEKGLSEVSAEAVNSAH